MNKFIVTFDKSQEDIPTLVVTEESPWFSLTPQLKVVNVITGKRAIEIWDDLKKKYNEQNK